MTEDGKIHGYNPLSDAQKEAIETVKRHEENLAALLAGVEISGDIRPASMGFDPDFVLLRDAKKHFMLAYMLLIRAIACPEDPYKIALERAEETGE